MWLFLNYLLFFPLSVLSATLPLPVRPEGNSSFNNVSQSSNISSVTNLSRPPLIPGATDYTFQVPNTGEDYYTSMILYLGYGTWSQEKLDGFEMRRLILGAQANVTSIIWNNWEEGSNAPIPNGPDGKQLWTFRTATDYEPLEVAFEFNTAWDPEGYPKITWQSVAEVLEGLRLFLIEGRRYYTTGFHWRKYTADEETYQTGQGWIAPVQQGGVAVA